MNILRSSYESYTKLVRLDVSGRFDGAHAMETRTCKTGCGYSEKLSIGEILYTAGGRL